VAYLRTTTPITFCYIVLSMGKRSTYFTDDEEQAIEQIAEKQDRSFSKVVRRAVKGYYEL